MIKYCSRCVMPDTKPDFYIDKEGVCSACRNFDKRKVVDWDTRQIELEKILTRYRNHGGSNWDCIVPVSGGKDSTTQVIRILQLGMNPLCVTATTCDLSEIGRRNIENIKQLGVDYVEFSPNPKVRAKLNRIGLAQVGDISWPEHVGIFTIPVRAAVQFRVPLLIWGENPQNEYGGPAQASENNVLNRRWLEEFGGLLGLRVSDLIGVEGIETKHLIPYTYPTDEELAAVGVTGLFLGYYMPWDGYANALLANAYGFQTLSQTVEGSVVNYENLDNHQTGIHDYFKFLKFGFGRATDIACLHIRRNRITRQDGLNLVRMHDGKFPWTYLGKPLEDILEPLELTTDEFIKICDRFTNKKIFKTDSQGNLVKDRHGNLTKINYDNESHTPISATSTLSAIPKPALAATTRALIIDYGMSNLRSVYGALEACGTTPVISDTPHDLTKCSHIILPGVGSFAEGMAHLRKNGWEEALQEAVLQKGIPILGICLGMQLIAQMGTEGGNTPGLGFVSGTVQKFESPDKNVRIPHIGWNEVLQKQAHPLFATIPENANFYFVHSYHVATDRPDQILAQTPYCHTFVSAVVKDHILGVQFHPEKSQKVGLRLLKNFLGI